MENKNIIQASWTNNDGRYDATTFNLNEREYINLTGHKADKHDMDFEISTLGFGMLLIELAKKDYKFLEFMQRVVTEMENDKRSFYVFGRY